jgi:hypothetical protein
VDLVFRARLRAVDAPEPHGEGRRRVYSGAERRAARGAAGDVAQEDHRVFEGVGLEEDGIRRVGS